MAQGLWLSGPLPHVVRIEQYVGTDVHGIPRKLTEADGIWRTLKSDEAALGAAI